MKNWFYRVFGKESSFAFKMIYCFIIAILIILYLKRVSHLFEDFTFNNYLSAMAVFVSICFTIFSIFDYIMVHLVHFLKYRKKYKFPNNIAIVKGVKYIYDPRINQLVKTDSMKMNPALIMYDLMLRADKRVRQDPYIRDMIVRLANYCDEKVSSYDNDLHIKMNFKRGDDPEGNQI